MLKKNMRDVDADHYYNRGGLRESLIAYIRKHGPSFFDDLVDYGMELGYAKKYAKEIIWGMCRDDTLERVRRLYYLIEEE
jgi:hypothetical protein